MLLEALVENMLFLPVLLPKENCVLQALEGHGGRGGGIVFTIAEVCSHQSHPPQALLDSTLDHQGAGTLPSAVCRSLWVSPNAIMTLLPDCVFVWVTHTSVGMLPGPTCR